MSENLDNKSLIDEKYQRNRPACGYRVSLITLKGHIWDLPSVEQRIGLELTESKAVEARLLGFRFIFSNPNARYFNVGSLGRDQVGLCTPGNGLWIKPSNGCDLTSALTHNLIFFGVAGFVLQK